MLLQAPDHVRGRGEALAAAAIGRGLAALLARRANAPVPPGRRLARPSAHRADESDDLRHRRYRRAPPWRHPAHPRRARRRPADVRGAGGRAARSTRRRLAGAARADLPVSDAPLDGVQPVNATWLRPALTATVRHQGRSAGGALLRPDAARGSRRRRSSLVRAATRGGGPDRAARGDAILADAPHAATAWRRAALPQATR